MAWRNIVRLRYGRTRLETERSRWLLIILGRMLKDCSATAQEDDDSHRPVMFIA